MPRFPLLSLPMTKPRFIAGVKSIIGPSALRVLYIPDPNDGLVSQDYAVATRAWTHNALPASSRYTRQGNGWLLNLDGSSQYLTSPDAADVTFLTGWSYFGIINHVTGVSAILISKWDSVTPVTEWKVQIRTTNGVFFNTAPSNFSTQVLVDTPSGALPSGVVASLACSTDSLTTGQPYVNGVAVSPTITGATSGLSDTAVAMMIGASTPAAPVTFFGGALGPQIMANGQLTADQFAALDRLARKFLRY